MQTNMMQLIWHYGRIVISKHMVKFFLCLTIFLSFSSCKYKLSTYSADTPKQKLNAVNLARIEIQEATESPNFKIALIADTHNYYEELADMIDTINSRGPFSFVIVAGDITNLGLLEEYDNSRRFLNKLIYPYLVAVGNHDLLANGDPIYKKMFGHRDFAFSYKGIQFIIFDNNNWENSGTVPDTAWVEARLFESNASERILIAHVPPNDRDRFTDDQIKRWQELVDFHNIHYFFTGHNHTPEESTFGRATHITIGAPSKGSYFELMIGPGGIQHQKVDF